MPLLLVVRHGENDYVKKGRLAGRKPGVHLNDAGRQQAQQAGAALAKQLKNEHMKEAVLRGVYSSPMERCMETAELVAQALELQVVPCQGLIEVDIGEWQDKTVKSLSRLKTWRVVQAAPSLFHFPKGESFATAQHRIVQEVQGLVDQSGPKDVIIVVSHADPIKLLVAYYLGLPLDFFQRLSVSPASLTALHIGEMGARLLALNIEPPLIPPHPIEPTPADPSRAA